MNSIVYYFCRFFCLGCFCEGETREKSSRSRGVHFLRDRSSSQVVRVDGSRELCVKELEMRIKMDPRFSSDVPMFADFEGFEFRRSTRPFTRFFSRGQNKHRKRVGFSNISGRITRIRSSCRRALRVPSQFLQQRARDHRGHPPFILQSTKGAASKRERERDGWVQFLHTAIRFAGHSVTESVNNSCTVYIFANAVKIWSTIIIIL